MLSNTISNSPKAAKPKFLVSGRLFCFISISKFGSFKNLFPMINSLSKFTLDSKIYSIGTNEKKKISMSCGSITSNWKPWRWVRYSKSNLKPLTKSTCNGKKTAFKNILPWSISQMITKIISISTRTVTSYATKRSIPFWVW